MNKKTDFIIICLMTTILFLTIGYAAFIQQLNVIGTASITSIWDIEITNIRSVNDKTISTNQAYDITDPSIGSDKVFATFKTGLVNPNDTRIYEIEVTNFGTLDAQINTSIQSFSSNPAIEITYEGMANISILSNDGTFIKTNLSKEEPFALPANLNNVKYVYISVKYADVETQPTNIDASLISD